MIGCPKVCFLTSSDPAITSGYWMLVLPVYCRFVFYRAGPLAAGHRAARQGHHWFPCPARLLLYGRRMLVLPGLTAIPGIYYGATAIDLLCTIWLLLITSSDWRFASRHAQESGERHLG